MISIHAPHTRGDLPSVTQLTTRLIFQSTPLIRGATAAEPTFFIFVSISIHAPHTRGDHNASCATPTRRYFNPRPSYEGRLTRASEKRSSVHFNPRPSYEGRQPISDTPFQKDLFQSTPLIRGATRPGTATRATRIHFNPRPSYEGRLKGFFKDAAKMMKFQSTPLIRGATRARHRRQAAQRISIHAPHTRGDTWSSANPCRHRNFNPRPSYEGRLVGPW